MLLRYSFAAILCLLYIAWCFYLYKKQKPRQVTTEFAKTDWHTTWLIAYASQTGQAQALAQQTAEQLGQALLIPLNQLKPELLAKAQKLLIIASSYGEGEAPDNGRYFLSSIRNQDLSHLRYAILALGDSSYDEFCGFAKQIEQKLQHNHAKALFERIEVDRLNSQALQQWQQQLGLKKALNQAEFYACELLERRWVNPGSQGRPVYYLRFQAPKNLQWQAGDIAQIQIANLQENGEPLLREYSIASLAGSGVIELLVRQHKHGIGSAWLAQTLPLHGAAQLRVRSNPSFYLPEQTEKAIFIANGTGIAGVRAHILQRQQQNKMDNWLVFGERQAAFDVFFKEDIERWQSQRLLSYCDFAFSREQSKCYVQDCLFQQQGRLLDYIEQGAYLVICGNKESMAQAIEQLLLDLLGQAGLQKLIEQGRYIRDVY